MSANSTTPSEPTDERQRARAAALALEPLLDPSAPVELELMRLLGERALEPLKADAEAARAIEAVRTAEDAAAVRAACARAVALVGSATLDRAARSRRRRRLAKIVAICSVLIALVAAIPALHDLLRGGATFRASSALPGYEQTGHLGQSGPYGLLFHTKWERRPWVVVDLRSVQPITGVHIVNRADCCQERASHIAVEFSEDGNSYSRVAEREETFDEWDVEAPANSRARYVRIISLRATMLHFADIVVR
ncbi:MAG: discoidin domain-containing protein [Polyangiaceae bacterium]